MTLGGLHGNGSPRVQDFYGSVDAMLVVGSRLRGHETGDFSMKLPKTLIHADCDASADGRTYGNSLFLHGDAALVMSGIADRLAGRSSVDAGFAGDFAALKSRAREEYLATLGPYSAFPDAIRAALPRDGVFVRDIATNAINRAMVKAINEVGHVMGLKTVAEYVEDAATLAVIRELGIDYAQGYAVGGLRPLTAGVD